MSGTDYKWDEVETVIKEYTPMLYKIAYSYTGTKEDAEDVLQDVFIKYAGQKAFQSDEHRKAWLIRVTINCGINVAKSTHRQRTIPMDGKENYLDFGKTQEQSDFDMKRLVMDLPLKYRASIFLYYYEGYTVEEIATILEKKPTAIYTLLRRARAMLKKIIEEGGGIYG